MSAISNFLNQIKTAIYGEEVRGAIHDAIEQCYTDVSNGVTLANTAANNANAKATAANNAASAANTAANTANTATNNMDSKIDDIALVQANQPSSATNKIWVQPQSDEYKVPTWEEFEEVENSVTYGIDSIYISGWINGKKINLGSSSVGSVASDPNYRYVSVQCKPGDIFTINATGQNAYRVYAFASSNGTILSPRGDPDTTLKNEVVEAPENATLLYINDTYPGGMSFKGNTPITRLSAIEGYKKYLPKIIKFGELLTEAGGIYESTHVVRAVASYKHTNPIQVHAGDRVIAYLTGSRAYSLISMYSANEISAETYISSIVGRTADAAGKAGTIANYFDIEIENDCYVVFTCNVNGIVSNEAQAFILQDFDSGNRIQNMQIQRIQTALESTNNLVESALIMHLKTINASGRIINKDIGEVSGLIECAGYELFTLQVWNCKYASINFYNSSDLSTSYVRLEYPAVNFVDGHLQVYFECPADAIAFRVCIDSDTHNAKYSVKRGLGYYSSYTDGPLSSNPEVRANIVCGCHRGWHYGCPENSVEAFVKSKERGFAWIENDVRFTSDGVGVLLHDESINRVARNLDGTELESTVNIADISYAQALQYDFGIYAGEQYTGTKICTLEDCLDICRRLNLGVLLEVKTAGYADYVVDIVKKYDMSDRVIYESFNANVLTQIASIVPTGKFGLIRGEFSNDYMSELTSLKTQNNVVYACLDYSIGISETIIQQLANADIKLGLYTVDDMSYVLNDIPRYASEIVSNTIAIDKTLAVQALS